MKKTVIFCYSRHHENTLKIAEAVRDRCGAQLVRLPGDEVPDIRDYELVGFASGIYASSFGHPLTELLDRLEGLEGKDCFTMYTSGFDSKNFDAGFVRKLQNRGADVIGRFACTGFDTFGPFKLV